MVTKNRNQIIVFFFLAFILAWGTWLPAFMIPNFPKLFTFVGLFAPAISSLVVAGIYNGRNGVFNVLRRYKNINFSVRWYIVAILLLPFTYALAILLNMYLFHYPAKSVFLGSPIYFIIVSFIWLMVINSGEEIGWRGFALPILLKECKSTFWASFLLGLIWGLWHLPLYLIPGQSFSFPYPLFLLLTIGLSFIYTELFKISDGSLIPAILLHAGTDIGPRIFQTVNFTHSMWLTIDIIIVIIGGYLTLKVSKK